MGLDVFKLSCIDFFSGHFKSKDFFCSSKIFKKKLILRSIFRDFTGSPQPGSGEAVCKARRLIFPQ
jgi:hypothetical protein